MAHPNSVIVPVFQETTYESREERRGRNPSRMTKEIQSDDANMETQSQSSEAANTIEEPSVPPQSSPTPIAEPTIDTARSPRPITPSGTQESEAIGSSRARMSTELYDDITQSKLHQHRSINDLESGTSESTLQSGNEPVRSENHRCSSPVSNGDEEELSADNAIGEPAEVNTGVNGDKPSINMALEYAESIHIDQDVHEGLLDCLEGPPYNSQDKSAPTTPTSSRVQMIRAQSPPTTDADPAESIEYSLAKDIPEPFALTLDIYKGLETSVMLRESTVASVPESPNVGKSNFTDTSYTAVEFSVFEPLATPKSNSNQHETTRPPSPLSKAGALEVEVTIEEDPNNMVLDEPVTAQRDIEDETEDFFTSDGSGDEGYAHSPYLAAIDSPELGVLDSLEPSELVLRLGDAQARESTEPEPLQRSSSPELGTAISPPRLPPSSPSPAPKCIPNSTPVSRKGSPSKPKSKSRTSMPMIPKKSSKPPIAKKKSTPSSSHRRTPSPKKKQLLLTSLLPDNGADEDDSDDDELSIIGSAQKASASLPAPRSFSPASLKRKHSLLAETTPHSSSNRLSLPGKTVAPATDSRARKGSIGRGREWGRTKLAPHSSPLVRAVANRMLATPRPRQNGPRPGSGSVGRFSSPGGGSARKCGVAGYTCDRDFCLTCCI
ncbi:hypothetical protein F5Y16DRAFT_397834 [Xylariaceae sp. FL0255]|nr:hypothetical protein F5Y16DRAFT_397834 [Xylariaceae sp. FL0255]